MISPRVTISRFSFGISKPTTDLPGIISTTRTLMADSARARSLARCADLADFHAGRGTQFEAGDDRARLHRHDLHFDAEIAQLELHQARHRLQRLVRIGLLACGRLIEQRQRRQLAGLRRVEQRHLTLALDAFAFLRGSGAGASILGGGRVATFFCSSRTTSWRACLRCWPEASSRLCSIAVANPFDALEHPGAEPVHHIEPGHARGTARRPQATNPATTRSRPESSSPCALPLPAKSPSTPPAAVGNPRRSSARVQAAAGDQGKNEPNARSKVLMRERVSGRE